VDLWRAFLTAAPRSVSAETHQGKPVLFSPMSRPWDVVPARFVGMLPRTLGAFDRRVMIQLWNGQRQAGALEVRAIDPELYRAIGPTAWPRDCSPTVAPSNRGQDWRAV